MWQARSNFDRTNFRAASTGDGAFFAAAMQDPLKNKAITAAHSHQASKPFLSPRNVDKLVTHLTQIQIKRIQKSVKPRRKGSRLPSNLVQLQPRPSTSMFVDNFIQRQAALPTSWEHPLAPGTHVSTDIVSGHVPRLWRNAESGDRYGRSRTPDCRRAVRLGSTFPLASGKAPHSSTKAKNAPDFASSRRPSGCYPSSKRETAYKPVSIDAQDSTTALHSFSRREVLGSAQALAEPLSRFRSSQNTLAGTSGNCSGPPSRETTTSAKRDSYSCQQETDKFVR